MISNSFSHLNSTVHTLHHQSSFTNELIFVDRLKQICYRDWLPSAGFNLCRQSIQALKANDGHAMAQSEEQLKMSRVLV
jgi:hypothetical protein